MGAIGHPVIDARKIRHRENPAQRMNLARRQVGGCFLHRKGQRYRLGAGPDHHRLVMAADQKIKLLAVIVGKNVRTG